MLKWDTSNWTWV